MTPRDAFFMRMTALAQMVPNFILGKEMLAIYEAQLKPLGYDLVCKALDQCIGNRSSRDPFPSVKEIKGMVKPELDPEAEAVQIASKLVSAVSRIGPYRTRDAKEFLGDSGWYVVECQGGWENVCGMLTNTNITTMQAQWRQIALSYLKGHAQGNTPQLPSRHGSKQVGELRSLGETLKQIENKGEKSGT